jgi:hypothetical protein
MYLKLWLDVFKTLVWMNFKLWLDEFITLVWMSLQLFGLDLHFYIYTPWLDAFTPFGVG